MRIFDRSLPTHIEPASCILPLPEPIQVSRPSPHQISIEWNIAADRVQIFSGNQPDLINFSQPLTTVSNQLKVQIPYEAAAVRPYFALLFEGGAWHGRCLLTAERLLPMPGSINFRDGGGYETRDGRVIAWAKLYRSGVLSELSASDLAYLQNLEIRLICDLRTEAEVEKRPDKLPTKAPPSYLHLPAQSLDHSARLRGLAAIFFNRANLDGLMDEGYKRIMIDDNAPLIGSVLKEIADPANLPIVVHCSAGKDRTAIIMALIFTILGVPQQTILADYTLSNLHYEKIEAGIAQEVESLRHFGITVDHLQAVILTRAERLQNMFLHIDQKYGSVQSYLLNFAGLHSDDIHQIRQNFLVNKFVG